MKRGILIIVAALFVALGAVAAVAADPGTDNPGSPGDACSRGASDQDCRPDPQPEHGQDCDDHGVARGNEDHCGPTETPPETTPDETTPVDTTPVDPPVDPTTPEVTTSTPTTTTESPGVSGSAPSAPVPTPKPKTAKKAAKAAKKAAVTIVKVSAPKANGVVVVTTADGKRHTAVMGSG